MCNIVNIDPSIPISMNSNSGGAQYILKNVDDKFWSKVERDAEELYYQVTQLNNQKKQEDPTYHELQIWCADMWSVLWNGWIFNNETKVVPEMDFSWATDSISRWDEATIYHNAGVTCSCGRLFYKSSYMNVLPYNIDVNNFNKEKNCYNYVLEIKETSKKTIL